MKGRKFRTKLSFEEDVEEEPKVEVSRPQKQDKISSRKDSKKSLLSFGEEEDVGVVERSLPRGKTKASSAGFKRADVSTVSSLSTSAVSTQVPASGRTRAVDPPGRD